MDAASSPATTGPQHALSAAPAGTPPHGRGCAPRQAGALGLLPTLQWREHNVARRKDVTLGPLLGEQVIVTVGLTAGEPVITDGAAWLTDGRSVRVVSDDGG